MGPATMTLAETRRRIRIDRERLRRCLTERGIEGGMTFSPALLCVRLYRYSRYFYVKGWRRAARLVWQLNLFLTGADISPLSDLGEGLLVVHPFAVTISGSAGKGLTVEGWGGMGGGMSLEDIGAGPGLPLLGDDVQLDRSAMVLGAVRVGHGVRIGPGCTVVRHLPDGARVEAPAVRVRRAGEQDEALP